MPEVYSSSTPTSSPRARRSAAHPSASKKHVHPSASEAVEAVNHRHVDEYSETMRGEECATNSFAAFLPKPVFADFESLAPNEHIVLALRRHPITNVPWIVVAILLMLGPVVLQFVPFLPLFPARLQLLAILGWYLIVAGYVIESFLAWFFNINVITDERIIDIDFENLIYKRVSSAKIDNIEDVTSSTGGFIRSLLSFGNVLIQTAGEKNEFEFRDVPQPEKVIKVINEMILEEEREQQEGRVQ